MRKTVTNSEPSSSISEPAKAWLDIEQIARAEVTSEDPQYPVEFAFNREPGLGWRAARPGPQTIRLIFDEPQRLRRISLRFSESNTERRQEFTLRWFEEQNGSPREITRQQWNFSPSGSSSEIEDYRVNLEAVRILELIIDPDSGKGQAVAALAEWRLE